MTDQREQSRQMRQIPWGSGKRRRPRHRWPLAVALLALVVLLLVLGTYGYVR